MRSKTKLFAVAATVMLVLTAFAPAATAAVAATGNDAGNTGDAGNTEDGDAGNAPANETNDTFGMEVSTFVHSLMETENATENETFGHLVADFVLENNPAADKIPDHAGPPENETQGPPDHATNQSGGPPEDAGEGGGPPAHAGGPSDDADDEADEES